MSLFDIINSLSRYLSDYDKLKKFILDFAITLTGAERGVLLLMNREGKLEFAAGRNIKEEQLEGRDFVFSKMIINQTIAKGDSLFFNEYDAQKRRPSIDPGSSKLKMVVCLPFCVKEQMIGLLYLDSYLKKKLTDSKKRILKAFASLSSIAIENCWLYNTSIHDPLTELYNLNYLRQRLAEEISRGLRYKRQNISFVLFEIDDHFKLTEIYGQQVGDTIIKRIGELVKKNVRDCDIPARYNESVFAIMMPETDNHGATCFVHRLQEEIKKQQFKSGDAVITVTLSFGISSFSAEKIISGENIITEAINSLNIAKSKGGDTLVSFVINGKRGKEEPLVIGRSKAIQEIMKAVNRLACTDTTVLIQGETGTGKELIAQLIHKKSPRHDKPFVVVNCGAIPETLLESELFGYERGAFTGAYKQHKGKFEQASGGTIFFDEIGELPLHLQVKTLRAIEQKEIDRLGGKQPLKVDVRLIAASNKDLEACVRNGTFREDLYYRLSIANIYLPPLRERPEDIEPLLRHYLNLMNKKYHRAFRGFTSGALEALIHHTWPGNVRELIHRIERAVVMSSGQYLDEVALNFAKAKVFNKKSLREIKNEAEREALINALNRNRGNVSKSSKELGISRKTLRDLMKKYNISKKQEIFSTI